MEETFVLPLLLIASLLCCTTNQETRLTVRPGRSQHFVEGSLILSCVDDGGSEKWIVWRNTTTGVVSQCGNKWGRQINSDCINSMALLLDSGFYWCESSGGAVSSSIQLTVTGGSVILQSPVLPVMEGDNVTLSCLTKNDVTAPATFYKDGSLMSTEPADQTTLHQVSRSDGGLYRCNVRGHGDSPASWLYVTDKPRPTALSASATSPSLVTPQPVSSSLPIRLLCHLVVVCPFVVTTLLLVSLCQQRHRK